MKMIVNYELEVMLKEAAVVYLRVLSWHLPGGLRKIMKILSQVVGLWADI
jgi:hypothetical protein